MSLPEVFLTLRRDKRRHNQHQADSSLGQAYAFKGGKSLETYVSGLLASARPDTAPDSPAVFARGAGIPRAASA